MSAEEVGDAEMYAQQANAEKVSPVGGTGTGTLVVLGTGEQSTYAFDCYITYIIIIHGFSTSDATHPAGWTFV